MNFSEMSEKTPSAGGGLPVLQYLAEKNLSPVGPQLWQTLNHQSACLACAWGTGLMNAMDAKKAGFEEHQRVTVRGDAGRLENIEVIVGAIREGTGFMFYPETNGLFKATIDPRSGTPAYKRVPVWVY